MAEFDVESVIFEAERILRVAAEAAAKAQGCAGAADGEHCPACRTMAGYNDDLAERYE